MNQDYINPTVSPFTIQQTCWADGGGLLRFTRLVLSACQMQSAHGQMSVLLSGVNITFIFSLKMEVRSNPYRGLWGRYVGILSIFLLVTSSTRHLQNT